MFWQPTRGILQPNQHWRRPLEVVSAGNDPSTIFGANLMAWYKADVGVSLSGSNVTAVADQSGNGRTATALNNAPVFGATSFNGGPGITHASAIGSGLGSSNFNLNSAIVTFWIVAIFTSLGGATRIISYTDVSSSDYSTTANVLPLFSGGSSSITIYHNSVAATWGSAAASTYYRLIVVFDGTTETLYVNGVQQAQAASTTTMGSSTNKFITGYNASGGSPDMVTPEWGMAKQDGTSSVTTLDNYLKTKWSL